MNEKGCWLNRGCSILAYRCYFPFMLSIDQSGYILSENGWQCMVDICWSEYQLLKPKWKPCTHIPLLSFQPIVFQNIWACVSLLPLVAIKKKKYDVFSVFYMQIMRYKNYAWTIGAFLFSSRQLQRSQWCSPIGWQAWAPLTPTPSTNASMIWWRSVLFRSSGNIFVQTMSSEPLNLS